MPFCITNTFTSHTVISFFIIPSVTFLCNGIWRVCLTLDGHRDAARAASLLTQWRACSRGANLVSVIQPCKTGAQPAALFLTRLCVCCPMKQQTTAAGRVYGFRCAAGTAGAAGAVSGVNLCSAASFWPVTNGICCDVFRPILEDNEKPWQSICIYLHETSSLSWDSKFLYSEFYCIIIKNATIKLPRYPSSPDSRWSN